MSVIELGAGMAALAGMTVASNLSDVQLLITDGHPDAILNNRVNGALNDWSVNNATVECERLLWTTDALHSHQNEFDLALASDCTHFQDHHAGLMITLADVLKVGGVAILCQPTRADSLDNFVTLYASRLWSNFGNSDYSSRATMRPSTRDMRNQVLIPTMNQICIIHNSCWGLTKKRQVVQEDRDLALEHVQCRELGKPFTPPVK